jgi:nucleotide-binding universal stress UspA family protein
MYETLLVPTDGSETVDRTLPHALRLAADHGATVHALYVVDQRVVRASSDELREDVRTDLERQGEAAVEAVAERSSEAGVECETAIRHGTPDKEIVAHAEETDADVVVIGPHGKTPRRKVEGLGSVSDRVVADAPTSVFLVKGDVDGDGNGAD